MRRLILLAVVTAAAAATPYPATANVYCDDVLGIPGSGYGPVCTVRCVKQHDPSVDPGRDPVVDPGRPACMDQD